MHAVAMQACSPSHRAIDKHIHVLKLGQHCVCQVLALQGGGGTGELLTGVGLPGTGQMLGQSRHPLNKGWAAAKHLVEAEFFAPQWL